MMYAEETDEGQAIIKEWEEVAAIKADRRNALQVRGGHLFLSVSQEDLKAQFNALSEEMNADFNAMVAKLMELHQRLNQSSGDTDARNDQPGGEI
jgi:hypothetical protein